MKKYFLILIILFVAVSLQAQKSCRIQRGEAYYYKVLPGVNNTEISIDGSIHIDKTPAKSNISIYLITNCLQTPFIFYSRFGETKMKLEFIKIDSDKNEAGRDKNGNLKIVRVTKSNFLWKANYQLESDISNFKKYKIILKGIIGEKKFTYSIQSIIELQTISMY